MVVSWEGFLGGILRGFSSLFDRVELFLLKRAGTSYITTYSTEPEMGHQLLRNSEQREPENSIAYSKM